MLDTQRTEWYSQKEKGLVLLCDALPVEHAPPDHVLCRVALQLAPRDESLARVVAVLLRKRWSILELHHRRGEAYDAVQLIAAKRDGRPDHLVAALEREVGVISIQS